MLLFFALGIKICIIVDSPYISQTSKLHLLFNFVFLIFWFFLLLIHICHEFFYSLLSPQGLIFVFLPQRPCCYRLISHPDEHAVECIIISQYRQKKQNNFREMLNSPNQNVKMCFTWVFRKAPFDIDLKMIDRFNIGNGGHFYKSAE